MRSPGVRTGSMCSPAARTTPSTINGSMEPGITGSPWEVASPQALGFLRGPQDDWTSLLGGSTTPSTTSGSTGPGMTGRHCVNLLELTQDYVGVRWRQAA